MTEDRSVMEKVWRLESELAVCDTCCKQALRDVEEARFVAKTYRKLALNRLSEAEREVYESLPSMTNVYPWLIE